MKAVIWTSEPDVTDGYYVELVETGNITEYGVWRATIEQCKAWALKNGVTKIEEN